MLEAQRIQEHQYNFPYHHVSKFRRGFRSTYFVKYGLKHAASMEWILAQIDKIPFSSICDIGCGDGRLVAELNSEFPKANILGIDYSQRSIHLAQGIFPAGNFQRLDILNEKLNDRFDLLTLIEVFEHIPVKDCEDFARGVANLANPGGYLMITVPHQNLPLSSKHFQHFTKESLTSYFLPYFDLEAVDYLERRGGWRLYFYYRLLKNKLFLLNNQTLLNWIYQGYKKHLLKASSEQDCERLFFLMKRK